MKPITNWSRQIQALRIKHRFSQSQAAKALGWPVKTIQAWEQSRREPAAFTQAMILNRFARRLAHLASLSTPSAEIDAEAARLIYHAKTGFALTRPQYMRRCKKEGITPLPMAQWREIVETSGYDGPEEDDEPEPEYPRHEELKADYVAELNQEMEQEETEDEEESL